MKDYFSFIKVTKGRFILNFKKNLAAIPKKVEETTNGKFNMLLVTLFILPMGSILCLFAIYFRLKKYL
jgi:serine protease inhibitor